ncbi:MAG: YidC/Oxa1 family membrane protein insertase [bacterium]|nr:YidC/Oxa1 family membrane protein insertase [bacterium]
MFDLFYSLWLKGLYQPIYNLVIFTYNISPGPSFGLTIIGLAILIRFLFLYFTLLGYKHEEQLVQVQPTINRIEKDNSLSNKEKLAKISAITKPLGVNPLLSSLPLFAQLVFLGVLYQIIQVGIYSNGFGNLYRFVSHPGEINTQFFGFNLAHPSILLALIAAGVLLTERIWEYNEKKEIGGTFAQKWDPLIWPLGTFIILLILPSAKAVFLITSVVFSFVIKSIVQVSKPKPAGAK